MLKPVTLYRNDEVPDEVIELIAGLPSYAKPAAAPKPIKRILKAAQALAQDDIVTDADKLAHETMFEVLDAITEENAEDVEAQVKQIMTADIRRILAARGEPSPPSIHDSARCRCGDRGRRAAAPEAADHHLGGEQVPVAEHAGRHQRGRRERRRPLAVDITGIRARVAALAFIDADVQKPVEDAANSLTQLWLTTKSKAIAKLPDSRKPVYEAIQDMAREREPVDIEIKDRRPGRLRRHRSQPASHRKKHLLATPDGDYPLEMKMAKNRWERATIRHEQGLGTLEGWYRNPSSAGKNSLRIAHRTGEKWKSVQPDFCSSTGPTAAAPSIIDPHGAHLGDSIPKLKALAEYADEHGEKFDRIIAVGVEKDGVLTGLDLKSSKIRRAVYECPADTDSIAKLYETKGTKYTTISDGLVKKTGS